MFEIILNILKEDIQGLHILVSLDLRNGRVNKEKAKEIIKLYEGKRPATLDIFLDYIGLSEEAI